MPPKIQYLLAENRREGVSARGVRMETVPVEKVSTIQRRRPVNKLDAFSFCNLLESRIHDFEMLARTGKAGLVDRQQPQHDHARAERSQSLVV